MNQEQEQGSPQRRKERKGPQRALGNNIHSVNFSMRNQSSSSFFSTISSFPLRPLCCAGRTNVAGAGMRRSDRLCGEHFALVFS
jgi:hypothetical protein